jgi:serine/threonine protein kinase
MVEKNAAAERENKELAEKLAQRDGERDRGWVIETVSSESMSLSHNRTNTSSDVSSWLSSLVPTGVAETIDPRARAKKREQMAADTATIISVTTGRAIKGAHYPEVRNALMKELGRRLNDDDKLLIKNIIRSIFCDAEDSTAEEICAPMPLSTRQKTLGPKIFNLGPYMVDVILGHGKFGYVYHATMEDPESKTIPPALKDFAVKVIPTRRGNEDTIKAEIEIMKKFDHPNVLLLLDSFQACSNEGGESKSQNSMTGMLNASSEASMNLSSPSADPPSQYDQLCLVLEYMEHNQLMFDSIEETDSSLILNNYFLAYPSKKGPGSATSTSLQGIFKDLIQGMQHVHSKGIIHRDIKPHNVMVASNGCCKLADFGISNQLEPGASGILDEYQQGTLLFWPPELDSSGDCGIDGYLADIWALGVTFYCTVFWKPPFDGDSMIDLAHAWKSDVDYSGISSLEDNRVVLRVLKGFLTKDPKNRMSLQEALDILNSPPVETREVECMDRTLHLPLDQSKLLEAIFTSTASIQAGTILSILPELRLPETPEDGIANLSLERKDAQPSE